MQIKLTPAAPAAHAAHAGHAGGDHPDDAGTLHAFGHALGDAMQGRRCDHQDGEPVVSKESRQEKTPRPTSTADAAKSPPVADTAEASASSSVDEHDDKDPPADSQLSDGLQAFVNSLQAPVTAATMPVSDAPNAADNASSGRADVGTDDSADALAVLGAEARGTGHAGRQDEQIGAHARSANALTDINAGRPSRIDVDADASHAADALAAARSDALAHAAPATPATPSDAKAFKAALQEALPSDISATSSPGTAIAVHAALAAGSPPAPLASAGTAAASHVAPALHAPQWQDAFGQQVLWVARNEQQLASLTLNPPELGPVRVTLSIADGQASASFVSLQPEVRQAIQEAVPRLKELFADAGLSLQQASVGSGDAGTDRRHTSGRVPADEGSHRSSSLHAGNDAGIASLDDASMRVAHSIASSRLIDLFA